MKPAKIINAVKKKDLSSGSEYKFANGEAALNFGVICGLR
jgi:hypothetical protein